MMSKDPAFLPQQAEPALYCFFRCSIEQLWWEVNIFRFALLVFGSLDHGIQTCVTPPFDFVL